MSLKKSPLLSLSKVGKYESRHEQKNNWVYMSRNKRRLIAKTTKNILSEICAKTSSEKNCFNANTNNEIIQSSVNIDHLTKSDEVTIFSTCSTKSTTNSSNDESPLSETSSVIDVPINLFSFSDQLGNWAKKYNIPNNATTELLHILKPHVSDLPLDARTLLKTPRSLNIQSCCGGSFIYFGVEKNILKRASSGIILGKYPIIERLKGLDNQNIFTISVNVDGLPVNKSNTKTFWPILGILDQAVNKVPFVIGLYHGESKPQNSNEFLASFVNECKLLEEKGIMFNNENYMFRISCFIADAPARAFLKCIVNFNSLHGCEKCIQEGIYYGRTTWQYEPSLTLRTDEAFRDISYDEHQQCESVISKLNVGLVSQVVLDPMHLVFLGVVKRLIYVWVERGPKTAKLSTLQSQEISSRLLIVALHTPSEFSRKPREIRYFKFWKATEFRSFLLYFGPVVLKNILPDHLFEHFLIFHTAVYILCSPELCKNTDFQNFANQLLHSFVRFTADFYSKELMLYNFHNLLHIVGDVINFGPIDNYSAFPFESFMCQIKKMVQGSNSPLQQVAKRLGEIYPEVKLNESPESSNLSSENNLEFITYKGYKIGIYKPDNCFFTKDGEVILIKSIEANELNEYSLKCNFFSLKHDYFDSPLKSSILNIYSINKQSLQGSRVYSISFLVSKCFLMPNFVDDDWFVCIPMCNMKNFF